MQTTEILMNEHRVIERLVSALEIAANKLEQGEPVRPEFFIEASDFIRNYADGVHHRKEENLLFVAMIQAGFPQEEGPIGVMLHEHRLGRQFNQGMLQAAQQLAAGDESASSAVVENAQNYVALLRQHIFKEDRALFPMAERALSPDQQNQLNAGVSRENQEQADQGLHAKYLALAAALEQEAAS